MPMNPQKKIQSGYHPIPHDMQVPTATKTVMGGSGSGSGSGGRVGGETGETERERQGSVTSDEKENHGQKHSVLQSHLRTRDEPQ